MGAMTPQRMAVVERLRESLARGESPLTEYDLVAEPAALAAAATGTTVVVRPYEDGIIVGVKGVVYAAGGDAEADTMAERMHDKFVGVKITHQGKPKTNEKFEPLYTLCPKRALWVVMQSDLIEVTCKHLASAGIATLTPVITFEFIPFSAFRV